MRTFALPRGDKSILDKGGYLLGRASLQLSKAIKGEILGLSKGGHSRKLS